MLALTALVGFTLALLPIVLTPGASFTLASAKGAAGDRTGAVSVIVGTGAGILTHAVLAGWGLAGIVVASAELFAVIRIIGAGYLVALGLWMLWRSRGRGVVREAEVVRRSAPRTIGAAYAANVLNVKAASVYLTLAPQFLAAD